MCVSVFQTLNNTLQKLIISFDAEILRSFFLPDFYIIFTRRPPLLFFAIPYVWHLYAIFFLGGGPLAAHLAGRVYVV